MSPARQGTSGLGLDAQRKTVADSIGPCSARVASEFTEIESGKRCDRPELTKALQACRAFGAKLVIAKLDRLSRFEPGSESVLRYFAPRAFK